MKRPPRSPLRRRRSRLRSALRGSAAGALCAHCAGSPATGGGAGARIAGGERWVGTWACAPQLTETRNLPPAPGLSGNTLRQDVSVSIGGAALRVRLSNAYGDGPVTMTSVHVAASAGASAVDPSTDHALTFAGSLSITIPAGTTVFSDAVAYDLRPLATVAITIGFGATPADVTGHPGSRTTSYLQAGHAVSAASLPAASTVAHWYYVTGVDVLARARSAAVVALGDSITDGRGSTTDGNDRWPDALSRRLQGHPGTTDIGVLNEGIGGNTVLRGGLGPPAVQRFPSDVLGQSGARWLVVLEGVNDIGTSTSASIAADLIAAFGRFIDAAHEHGLRAYGVPILPFGGSMYDNADHRAAREAVNAWIRTSGRFDAVVDLDAAVRDPANPNALMTAYDTGDHLHLNPAGYRAMAAAVDLSLFSNGAKAEP